MAIEVVSTVGAGDSFLGGMVAALAAGKPTGTGVPHRGGGRLGRGDSPGTELCREEDVRRLPKVRINEVEGIPA